MLVVEAVSHSVTGSTVGAEWMKQNIYKYGALLLALTIIMVGPKGVDIKEDEQTGRRWKEL